MSNILVTGATGRVGANLVSELLKRGHDVRALVMPDDPASSKLKRFSDLDIISGSLSDQDAVTRAAAGTDMIAHLAAQMAIGDTRADRYFDTNALGTLRLLEGAVTHGVRRFVLASTDGTYDVVNPEYLPIDEQHPQLPGDRYGTSKLLSEVLVRNYAKQWGLETTIVRFGSIVAVDEILDVFRLEFARALISRASQGPDSIFWPLLKGHETAPDLVPRRDGNPAAILRGPDGSPWSLHLTDVRDAVAGTILALEEPRAVGHAFNIVGPSTVACTECAEVLGDALGIDAIEIEMPVTFAFEISHKKASELLGYEPKWTYRRMVESALAYTAGEASDVVPVAAT